ncbi:hypothetical protein BH23ACT6_BH23ACT6_10050 [soil metagenome]
MAASQHQGRRDQGRDDPAKVENLGRVGQLGKVNVRRQPTGKCHEDLAQALRDKGVTLNQVKVTAATAAAVNKVLREQQVGRTVGVLVDAVWINRGNFATGAQAEVKNALIFPFP